MTSFSLQAVPQDAASWKALAVRCEEAGFDALLVPDHPGSCASPFVALAAAAAVTSRIGLGSNVVNAGVREPILVAADVATLDVISGGRARLGVGAGHTPAEWRAVGRERPDVAGRVDHCLAFTEAVRALLDGEPVRGGGLDGEPVRDAVLEKPRPVQARIPLTLGTANSRMLRWAGEHADVVGLTGFGRTLEDGHQHQARWRPDQIERQIEQVRTGAAGRETPPELEALVQMVEITDDAEGAAAPHAERLGMSVADALAVPFVLIGTAGEIRTKIARNEEQWGITRYVVRQPALESIAESVFR
ncbi:LLM class flavin-dependent oxidoreductase [Actinoplanes rectilineatus]|uniref:LLM class flavin-dependent oxidoreductase n=1 Tax=Actinoplanes rectilineatus TaxID=113571 RepID=UPI0005F2E53C|nr:LLM class flavin-dependent oxidoreductase [Actinoplanes rectilineatus]